MAENESLSTNEQAMASLSLSATHINDLPPEVLGLILSNVLTQIEPETYYTSLKSLSKVCPHWHDTIDTTPELWTVINAFTLPSAISETLDKSGALPLRISYSTSGKNVPSLPHFVDAVLPTISRWKSASFVLPYTSTFTFLGSASAPELEELELGFAHSWHAIPNVFGGAGAVLVAPRLKRLQLRCTPVPWLAPLLSGLEVLSISQIPPGALKLEQLPLLLSANPGLRELVLERLVFLNAGEVPGPFAEGIELGHLQTLTLKGLSTFATAAILGSVRTPRLRTFCLDARGLNASDVPILAFLNDSGFAERFSEALAHATSVSIFLGEESLRLHPNTPSTPSPPPELTTNGPPQETLLQWFKDILQKQPLPQPLSISVTFTDNFYKKWSSFYSLVPWLGKLPRIEEITMQADLPINDLILYLSSPFREPPTGFPCPDLRRLRIERGWVYPASLLLMVENRYQNRGSGAKMAVKFEEVVLPDPCKPSSEGDTTDPEDDSRILKQVELLVGPCALRRFARPPVIEVEVEVEDLG